MNILEAVNLALDIIGETNINSFDNTKGKICERWANQVYNKLAEGYRLNFMRTSATLTANPKKINKQQNFSLPADFAQLYERLKGDYFINENYLIYRLSDLSMSAITIEYCSNDIDRINHAPATFIETFIYTLASKYAQVILKEPQLALSLNGEAIVKTNLMRFSDDIKKGEHRLSKALNAKYQNPRRSAR